MLYDPKWEQKPDKVYGPVSLRGFIAWLETQPADCVYDFTRPARCAIAQFLQSVGHSGKSSEVQFTNTPGIHWLEEIVIERPMTFGAALKRARAALNK